MCGLDRGVERGEGRKCGEAANTGEHTPGGEHGARRERKMLPPAPARPVEVRSGDSKGLDRPGYDRHGAALEEHRFTVHGQELAMPKVGAPCAEKDSDDQGACDENRPRRVPRVRVGTAKRVARAETRLESQAVEKGGPFHGSFIGVRPQVESSPRIHTVTRVSREVPLFVHTLLLCGVVLFACSGCATTAVYQRARLADAAMQLDRDDTLFYLRGKIEAAREGGLGGFGSSAAGGCGCQ